MKYVKFILPCILLAILTGNVNSQPLFILSATAGFSLPISDLRNDVAESDTIPGVWPYLMFNGYSFGGKGKIAIGKKRNIRIVVSANFTTFSNKGNVINVSDTSRLTEFKPRLNILTISLGAEYAFSPKEKTSAFLGMDVTANYFSGEFNFAPAVPRFDKTKLKSETRFGIQLNGGVDILLSKYFGAVFGVRLNWANIFGKSSGETGTAANELELGDKEHTVNGITSPSKNIMYLQPYLGVSLFLGQAGKLRF